MSLQDKLNKKTISRMIIDRITQAMIRGDLKPGDKLPTDIELASAIGVGRNSVREAIKIMEAFGIVEIRRGDGIYIVSEYHDGIVDPLLYGVILDNSETEDLGTFRLVYFQSVLLYGLDLFSEDNISDLKQYVSDLGRYIEVSDHPEGESIYRMSLKIENYIAGVSNNKLMIHMEEFLDKICSYDRLKKYDTILSAGDAERIFHEYESLVTLIERRDRKGIQSFFDMKRDE